MIMKKFHFITGLPRSGSTLLTSVLNQNPKFYSNITDGLAGLVKGVNENIDNAPGVSSIVSVEKKKKVIRDMVYSYYYDVDKEVIFNTNRGWSYLTFIMKELFPDSKFILCVRDIPLILNSFESAHRRFPFNKNTIFTSESSVYERMENLMQEKTGLVRFALDGLKQAITSGEKSNLMIVEYEQFCINPEGMMSSIYNFLQEEYFQHDFNNVEYSFDEYDQQVGILDLHTVRKKISFNPVKELIIPPDIVGKYSNMEVWRYKN